MCWANSILYFLFSSLLRHILVFLTHIFLCSYFPIFSFIFLSKKVTNKETTINAQKRVSLSFTLQTFKGKPSFIYLSSSCLQQYQGISLSLSSSSCPLYKVKGLTCSVFTQENVSGEILMLTFNHFFVLSTSSLNPRLGDFVSFCFFDWEALFEKTTQIISFHILIFNILNYF